MGALMRRTLKIKALAVQLQDNVLSIKKIADGVICDEPRKDNEVILHHHHNHHLLLFLFSVCFFTLFLLILFFMTSSFTLSFCFVLFWKPPGPCLLFSYFSLLFFPQFTFPCLFGLILCFFIFSFSISWYNFPLSFPDPPL